VWWTGPEAGDWSPASSVDRDCASGLVSSLVSSVVSKLTLSLRRLSVELTKLEHGVTEVQVVRKSASFCSLGSHMGGQASHALVTYRMASQQAKEPCTGAHRRLGSATGHLGQIYGAERGLRSDDPAGDRRCESRVHPRKVDSSAEIPDIAG
jgi:hypothetical protein